MADPNTHGVYEADEVLSLPRKVKGWCGSNTCDIEVANLGDHWIWAVSFQLHSGDFWGCGRPLVDAPACRAESRDAAIEAAAAYLREKLAKRAADYADARTILEWLERLQPQQPDLFSALSSMAA